MKKNLIHIFFFILVLILASSCSKVDNIELIPYEPKIVVEGRIENGTYATVLLSTSASMSGPKDTLSLLNQVIRSAKVSISDGETTDLLSLETNTDKIPPYEYKGRILKGEVSKKYTLKIEYRNKKITAETYIPQPVKLDKVWFVPNNPADGKGYIHLKFKNTTTDYYQISTKVLTKEKIFTPCLYGNIDRTVYPKDELVSMQISKGPIIFPKVSFSTYFDLNSLVEIRFSTQPLHAYKFWTSFQNEIINTQNPIFPANTNLTSNINGGIGIWSGYGTSYYHLDLSEKSK